ncbi:MAG: hypothetical protein P4L35_03910, partial [Ignavibacteriaceae bacterium]|nr:hypothetical protein [Ignavibacteriaceae bacterium]
WCEKNKLKPLSAVKLSKKLGDYKIDVEARTGNVRWVTIPAKQLLKLYTDQNWIGPLDEFDPDQSEGEDTNSTADTIDEDIDNPNFGDAFIEPVKDKPQKKSKKGIDDDLLNTFV